MWKTRHGEPSSAWIGHDSEGKEGLLSRFVASAAPVLDQTFFTSAVSNPIRFVEQVVAGQNAKRDAAICFLHDGSLPNPTRLKEREKHDG